MSPNLMILSWIYRRIAALSGGAVDIRGTDAEEIGLSISAIQSTLEAMLESGLIVGGAGQLSAGGWTVQPTEEALLVLLEQQFHASFTIAQGDVNHTGVVVVEFDARRGAWQASAYGPVPGPVRRGRGTTPFEARDSLEAAMVNDGAVHGLFPLRNLQGDQVE